MDFITLMFIAVGLSMDAFAVSVSSGLSAQKMSRAGGVKIAACFGVFQGLMPLIGYTVASTFADRIQAVDHWVAFALLAFVGGKMLWEAFRGGDEGEAKDPSQWRNLLVLAIATSIDALAVGASFAVTPKTGMFAVSYGHFVCCGMIAVTTFVISGAGVYIGKRFGNEFGNKAEIVGGIVLVGIGVKVLLEHTLFA